MSVNYGLDFLDLSEWSLYYARKALFVNPYSNTTHLGVALAYDQIGGVSSLQGFNEYANPASSEYLQGYIFDVQFAQFLQQIPYTYQQAGALSDTGRLLCRWEIRNRGEADITASGDFGSTHPLTYWMYSGYYHDTGYLDNSEDEEFNTSVTFGYKPVMTMTFIWTPDIQGRRRCAPQGLSVLPVLPFWSKFLGWFAPGDDNQEVREQFLLGPAGISQAFRP